MEHFLLSKEKKGLEKISKKANDLFLLESLELSEAGYICMQIKEGDEKREHWTGKGKFILSRYKNEEYELEFRNDMFDDQNLSIKKRFKTIGEWQFRREKFIKGAISAPLEYAQKILIYSI